MTNHFLKPILPALALVGLAGCATTATTTSPETETSRPSMIKTVSGTLSYRERIALPPGAQLELVVSDITLGENSELVLARQVGALNRAAPPVPFSIDVSKLNASNGPLYGLRAFIRDSRGTILFRTSAPVLLNLQGSAADVGDIMLAMTSPGDPGLAGLEGLMNSQWRVTQLGNDVVPAETAPMMTFTADGRVSGSTGCNSFNSRYELDGSKITLETAAMTRRACDPGLMQQERRFADAIAAVEQAGLDKDGRLVLSGSGQRIVAERK